MDPIAGISTSAPTTTVAGADAAQDLGKDTFLKLMVAQLRYQDPMAPSDSSDFLAQTAQFTSVEKLEEIADAMASLTRNDSISTIGNLVGRVVQHEDALGQVQETLVSAGRIHDDGITLLGADGSEIGLAEVIGVVDRPDPATA